MGKNESYVYFKKIACKGKYQDDEAIPDLIEYITREEKTPNKMIFSECLNKDDMAGSMIEVSERFKNNSRLRLHHFIISFEPEYKDEVDLLKKIAKKICKYIGGWYQIVAAVHEDTDHPHIHFVFNAVSYINGLKYRGGKKEYRELTEKIREALDGGYFEEFYQKYRNILGERLHD